MDAMDKYDVPVLGEQTNMRIFTSWVLLSQAFGLTSVILVAVWMGNFRGGFAWQENPDLEFNYHPLFMIIGMVFLYGDSILVYRVFRNEQKRTVKIMHAVIHALALVFAGVGLKAVFDSHNLPQKPHANMYTLHSWLGITTVALFGAQWIVGFFMFLLPGLSHKLKTVYKPLHIFWGLAVFFLALATALSGITEKSIWANANYETKNAEGILANCLGMVLVCLGLTIGFIVSKSEYARQTLPEEEHLQLTN